MKRKKILLVEDNLINQKIAKLMLQKFDQVIDVAENGLIAVEKFRNDTYDLILMDLHMPELNGFEATRKIREFEQENKHKEKVRIYAMTASSLQDESENCLCAGMDGYLSKPFRNDELMALLVD